MFNTLPSNSPATDAGRLSYKSKLITAGETYVWQWADPHTIFVSGAGGGGGGGRFGGSGGQGGEGGESYARVPMSIDPVTEPNVVVTIGQGGAGSAVNGAAGSNGTETKFGSRLTIAGGIGGAGAATDTAGTDASATAQSLPVPIDRAEGSGGNFFDSATGGTGNAVLANQGALGGKGNVADYRVSELDNTGIGGSPVAAWEGGGGGGSWGNGGGGTGAAPSKGGGGAGGRWGVDGQTGANGFILIEWWE